MFNLFGPCIPTKLSTEKLKKELCLAIINKNTNRVRSLLALGAPVDFLVTSQWGSIPLTHFTAMLSDTDTEILEAIINAGGSIDEIYELNDYATSGSILHNVLTAHGYLPTLSVLITNGAAVNSRNSKGCAVLHVAAQTGKDQTKLMLDNGANVSVLDNDNNTVMHYAKDQYVFHTLTAHHAKIDEPNLKGVTPLLRATECAKLVLISKLIAAGADIAASDKCGRDIIDYASENDRTLTFVEGKIAMLDLRTRLCLTTP